MNRIDVNNVFWSTFGELFLVKCPNCGKKAEVRPHGSEKLSARLTCVSCGYSKDRGEQPVKTIQFTNRAGDGDLDSAILVGPPVDWFFHEPLWLQMACGSDILWAYNGWHLAWLKEFVSAELRERRRDPESGWSNQALASRLPRWITSAKNRDRVLKAIKKLEIKNERSD